MLEYLALAGCTIRPGTMEPPFAPQQLEYEVIAVPQETTNVTMHCQPAPGNRVGLLDGTGAWTELGGGFPAEVLLGTDNTTIVKLVVIGSAATAAGAPPPAPRRNVRRALLQWGDLHSVVYQFTVKLDGPEEEPKGHSRKGLIAAIIVIFLSALLFSLAFYGLRERRRRERARKMSRLKLGEVARNFRSNSAVDSEIAGADDIGDSEDDEDSELQGLDDVDLSDEEPPPEEIKIDTRVSIAASVVSMNEVANPLLMGERDREAHGYRPMFAPEAYDGAHRETAATEADLAPLATASLLMGTASSKTYADTSAVNLSASELSSAAGASETALLEMKSAIEEHVTRLIAQGKYDEAEALNKALGDTVDVAAHLRRIQEEANKSAGSDLLSEEERVAAQQNAKVDLVNMLADARTRLRKLQNATNEVALSSSDSAFAKDMSAVILGARGTLKHVKEQGMGAQSHAARKAQMERRKSKKVLNNARKSLRRTQTVDGEAGEMRGRAMTLTREVRGMSNASEQSGGEFEVAAVDDL